MVMVMLLLPWRGNSLSYSAQSLEDRKCVWKCEIICGSLHFPSQSSSQSHINEEEYYPCVLRVNILLEDSDCDLMVSHAVMRLKRSD